MDISALRKNNSSSISAELFYCAFCDLCYLYSHEENVMVAFQAISSSLCMVGVLVICTYGNCCVFILVHKELNSRVYGNSTVYMPLIKDNFVKFLYLVFCSISFIYIFSTKRVGYILHTYQTFLHLLASFGWMSTWVYVQLFELIEMST